MSKTLKLKPNAMRLMFQINASPPYTLYGSEDLKRFQSTKQTQEGTSWTKHPERLKITSVFSAATLDIRSPVILRHMYDDRSVWGVVKNPNLRGSAYYATAAATLTNKTKFIIRFYDKYKERDNPLINEFIMAIRGHITNDAFIYRGSTVATKRSPEFIAQNPEEGKYDKVELGKNPVSAQRALLLAHTHYKQIFEPEGVTAAANMRWINDLKDQEVESMFDQQFGYLKL